MVAQEVDVSRGFKESTFLERAKRILLLTGAQCSFFIGAGFATGQESLQYFTAHGWWGIVAIGIVILLFSWMTASLTEWGMRHRNDKVDPFVNVCGKYLGTLLRFCVPLFIFAISVTMIAGAGALVSDVLGTPVWVGAAVMAIFVAATLFAGFRGLVEIIGRVGPVIVAIIAIVAIWVLIENFDALFLASETIKDYPPTKATDNWLWGTVLYCTAVLLMAVPFLTSLGRAASSIGRTVAPSVLTAFIFGGVMAICALAMLATLPRIFDQATPLVLLGIDLAPWLGYVFSIVTLLGIYSTAAPMLWTVADQIPARSLSRYRIVVVLLSTAALVGGLLFPFQVLVGFIYPSIGYFGLAFFLCLAGKQIYAKFKQADAFGRGKMG